MTHRGLARGAPSSPKIKKNYLPWLMFDLNESFLLLLINIDRVGFSDDSHFGTDTIARTNIDFFLSDILENS